MIKLKDIAAHLNVSVSTVSRVVNNQDRVDPDTRRRVLEALKKFNYQPDENARRLKTNTSNVLGVIVPDIANPFYAAVIKGIERSAAKSSYSVLVCNTDGSKEREQNAIRLLLRQKVAGLVAATTLSGHDVRKLYLPIERPVVFFDNVPAVDQEINCVTINNSRAARELTAHMIRQGHRRIFMIAGPAGESSANERLQGWRTALQDAGIEPGPDWSVSGDFQEASGRAIMTEFLRLADRPTAICIANNFMAYGAVKAILAAGLAIPGDISVGAFDITDAAGLMNPQITTIIQPAEDIGVIAADLCLQAGTAGGIKLGRRLVLEHQFAENQTVKKVSQPAEA